MIKTTDIESIQSKIINLLEDQLTAYETKREKIAYVFYRPNTIRLSYDGNRLLSKVVDSYPFKHNLVFKPRHYVTMANKFKYPFYASPNYIVLYSEKDAVVMSLISDADQFLS